MSWFASLLHIFIQAQGDIQESEGFEVFVLFQTAGKPNWMIQLKGAQGSYWVEDPQTGSQILLYETYLQGQWTQLMSSLELQVQNEIDFEVREAKKSNA